MNKKVLVAVILLSIGLSSCASVVSKHKSKDENCGTLEVCDDSHVHHNPRKHYDRH